jgi:Uma2 family endonuclease
MEATPTQVMTLEEFMQRYSDEGPFEILEGEIVPVNPQITRSARIGFRLARNLADYVDGHNLGEVFTEAPFVIGDTPQWVKGSRVPDIMFFSAERLVQLAKDVPDWEEKPLLIAPDLVVEIISPTDRALQVSKKVERYLTDGIQKIWLVDPEQKIVTVYTQGSKLQERLTLEDSLSGEDVIPGFELPLETLFS